MAIMEAQVDNELAQLHSLVADLRIRRPCMALFFNHVGLKRTEYFAVHIIRILSGKCSIAR